YTEGGEDLSLPESRLVAIHATCARMVRVSGTAEYMDRWDRDAEDLQVFSERWPASALCHNYMI
ncbi:hypothetical protein K488DRAFT_24577, partial [Vararia minispora EC-137]